MYNTFVTGCSLACVPTSNLELPSLIALENNSQLWKNNITAATKHHRQDNYQVTNLACHQTC